MLAEHGFVLESHQVVRRQVIHNDDLDVAMRMFNEDLAERGQPHLGPLPKEVITRLTRMVKLHVFEFSMGGGRERATPRDPHALRTQLVPGHIDGNMVF